MIKQIINVDNYWRVIVYYDIDVTLFSYVKRDITHSRFPVEDIDYILGELAKTAKAVTINIYEKETSIIIFTKHRTEEDYINSIVHEAEHVKEAMLEYYHVRNYGESPAYTIGYLVAKMYVVFKRFVER